MQKPTLQQNSCVQRSTTNENHDHKELIRHLTGCCESMNRAIDAARRNGLNVDIEATDVVSVHVSHVVDGVFTCSESIDGCTA